MLPSLGDHLTALSRAVQLACRRVKLPCTCSHASTRQYATSSSSKRWLQRATRDPHSRSAKSEQLLARSAYKLLALNDKYKLFRPGQTVLDLGFAPGAWSQVALSKVGPRGRVLGVDLLPVVPPRGTSSIQANFNSRRTHIAVVQYLLDPQRGRRLPLLIRGKQAANAPQEVPLREDEKGLYAPSTLDPESEASAAAAAATTATTNLETTTTKKRASGPRLTEVDAEGNPVKKKRGRAKKAEEEALLQEAREAAQQDAELLEEQEEGASYIDLVNSARSGVFELAHIPSRSPAEQETPLAKSNPPDSGELFIHVGRAPTSPQPQSTPPISPATEDEIDEPPAGDEIAPIDGVVASGKTVTDKTLHADGQSSIDFDKAESATTVSAMESSASEIERLRPKLVDVVLSDMMANTTGSRYADHAASIDLCDSALVFAANHLKPRGHFVCKLFDGRETEEIRNRIKQLFKRVHTVKPEASRKESTELYLVGLHRLPNVELKDLKL
ncbi:2' O-ribose methyltransferase [Savitreella phatthalungensis]